MTYVYVVTRIAHNEHAHIREIPNLGCHSSYKKAERHYKSVYADRVARYNGIPQPGQNIWHSSIPFSDPYVVLMSDHFPNEEIRLEKWRVK
jgi:hypothetical protein